jgi:hypothetical protein
MNDPVTEVELEEMPLADLRALADVPTAPVKAISDPEKPDDPEPEEYEYRIDLADGSGVQVFKGSSPEEVMDKLGEAQKHATIKIREQAEQLKRYSAQAEKEQADNEYIYGQELMTAPTTAFKKLFKETTGVDIDTFKTKWERVEAFEAAQQVQAIESKKNNAATAFLAAHPEFIANKSNGAKLEKAVNLLVAEAERNQIEPDFQAFLEDAYADLSESGLLQLKADEEIIAKKSPVEPVKEVQVVAHTRRASGLSQRAAAPTRRSEPTEEELYSMPLDKLRELGQRI